MVPCTGTNGHPRTVGFKHENVIDCDLSPGSCCDARNRPRIGSRPIPIPDSLTNRHSLPDSDACDQGEALADYRDFCMFSRVVNGMIRRQFAYQNDYFICETRYCIANIYQTRREHLTTTTHSHATNHPSLTYLHESSRYVIESGDDELRSFRKAAHPIPDAPVENEIFAIDL